MSRLFATKAAVQWTPLNLQHAQLSGRERRPPPPYATAIISQDVGASTASTFL